MRWLLSLIVGVLLGMALAPVADARPGGGNTYSSGGSTSSSSRSSGGGGYRSSSSSSGGSGGGHSTASGWVLGLGMSFLVIAVVGGLLYDKKDAATISAAKPPTEAPPAANFKHLEDRDPAFSRTGFEDFAFQLYARARLAAGTPGLAALTPYFAPHLLAALEKRTPISAVVIGSLRIIAVTARGRRVTVRVEANHGTLTGTTNVIERWIFRREHDVKTRPPEKARTLPCPNCNAPWVRGTSALSCAHCATEITPGHFDWTVAEMHVDASTPVGMTLTGTVAEVGNDLETIVAPDSMILRDKLFKADKNLTWESFTARVTMIYDRLNTAWNAQDLGPARGLVTSSLLGYLQFWIDQYQRQRLANRLEDAKVQRLELAKVLRDPYFDAITVRVRATGKDFTLDAKGNVVGGSKSKGRDYTEYWTLIRSSTRRGPVTTEASCPNCGAPLSISNAGACTHCSAEVENGSFDWVLSKIEQDEVYLG